MRKYRVRILYDVKFWAYYWRAMALKKYAPDDFEITMGSNYGKAFKDQPHDLVLQLAYSYAKDLRSHMNRAGYTFPLVASFNVGWGYANKWLHDTMKYSDHTIINSHSMWDKSGRLAKTTNISNGVDLQVFKPTVPIVKRPNKVLWIGSICHRKTKNYDTILVPLAKQLKAKKIEVDFRLVNSSGANRMNHRQMAEWYNTGSVYVVASRAEGTPNPGLEAAGCGLPVVSTRVGNMTELIVDGKNGYLCDTTIDSLYKGILKAIKNKEALSNEMSKSIQEWGWEQRSKQYFDLFRKLINEKHK